MPSTTPIRGRPFPNESDTPDVASDLHSLALNLDAAPDISSGLLAAMPSGMSTLPKGDEYLAHRPGCVVQEPGHSYAGPHGGWRGFWSASDGCGDCKYDRCTGVTSMSSMLVGRRSPSLRRLRRVRHWA
jgi:hypothetical protein